MNRILLIALFTFAVVFAHAKNPAPANVSLSQNRAPLSFIENKGQVLDQNRTPRPDIQFSLNATPGLHIFIGNGAIHYQFSKPEAESSAAGAMSSATGVSSRLTPEGVGGGEPLSITAKLMEKGQAPRTAYTMYRLDVELIGANPNAQIITEEKQDYYENYYTDWSGEQGAHASAYNRVTYKNVYPCIDWVFYLKDGQLKHEFVIQQGGKASDIHLKYGGAAGLKINADGSLTATTPQGTITEQAPKSYNLTGALVKTGFKLNGNILSYEMDACNGKMVIDPGLQWATYYLGNGEGLGATTAIDDSDNIYMAGVTSSTTGIATVGAYQSTFGGMSIDAYLVKFNSTGTIQWGTYYGGTADDYGSGTTVDANGNVYLCGFTLSYNGISTIGAYQYTLPLTNNGNAFIAKFTRAGTRLWGTYYGHSGRVEAHNVATDKWGNVYISGQAGSATVSIASAGAYQTTFGGGNFDAFLAKFDSTGAHLRWATYFGGNGVDDGNGLAIDTGSNIYISGATLSAAGIASPGAYQTTMGAGGNAFLAKFDTSGTRLWATYYGGSQLTQANAVAVDSPGNVYMAGNTLSTTGIATPGAYDINFEGAGDAFLVKFNATGSPVWGTYYGGAAKDCGLIVATDPLGYIYLSGYTASTTGIATPGAYQTINNGGTTYGDAFFAKFTPAGNRLYGTYYGGTGDDLGTGIAADSGGNVFLTGFAASHTNIATPGAYNTTGATYGSNFISRFATCAPPVVSPITGPTTVCALGTITLNDTTTGGIWASINTNIATISGGVLTGVAAGLDTITYSVTNGCGTTTVSYLVTINALPTVNAVNNKTICAGSASGPVSFTGTGTGVAYNWTCNNTGIGLAASGTGNIGSFTAVNNGTLPTSATITITPIASQGYAYVSIFGSDSETIINTATNTITATILVGSEPIGTSVNPAGTRVYIANRGSGTVSVINTATNTLSATITMGGSPNGVVVSPNGNTVYVSDFNNASVVVINAITNSVSSTIPVGSSPAGVAISPDGNMLYVANSLSNSVSVINTATNTVVATITGCPSPSSILVSPDGSKVYVSDISNVAIINTTTNTVSTYFSSNLVNSPCGLAISPDGSKLYIVSIGQASVAVVNTLNNTVIDTIGVGSNPNGLALSPDGREGYVMNLFSNSVSVFSTATNTVIKTIAVGTEPGSYGNFVSGGNGCTGTPITFTITVNPKPAATFTTSTGQTHFCQGDSLTLTAATETGYLWSTGATTQSIVIRQGGNERVTVTDNNGCTASTSQNISTLSAPTSAIVQGDTSICQGDSVSLTSVTQFQYLWSTGATTQNIIVKQPGSYTVQAISAVGCSNTSAPVTVTLNTPAAAVITPNGPITFCQGGSVTLATGAANSYLWSGGATTASIDVAQSGNYSVTVNGASSCSATSTATTVTVDTLPAAIITPHGPTTFCQGLNVSLVASTGTSYLWSNGAGTQLLSAAQTGNYIVTVTNSYNCSAASAPISVTVYPTGASLFNRSICAGQTISFNNQNINQSGVYNDTLQTIHGCDSIVTLNLSVNNTLQTSLSDTTCSGRPYVFNGHSLSVQGIYVDTLQSAAGCDSVVILSLWVDTITAPTITRNGNTLTTQLFNSYNWLLNGTTATGSTQSIVVTQNGNYSVVVTGAGGCTDTSAVLSVTTLGVQNVMSDYAVKLFPNPNTGNFTLQFTDDIVRSVEIADAVGRTVVPSIKVSKQQIFNADQLAGGVYILKVVENNETRSLKFSVVK